MKVHASRLLFGVELALFAVPPTLFLSLMGIMALTDPQAVKHSWAEALPFYIFLAGVGGFWALALSFLLRGEKALRGKAAQGLLGVCAATASLIAWGAYSFESGHTQPISMAGLGISLLVPIAHLFFARWGAKRWKTTSPLTGEDSGPVSV